MWFKCCIVWKYNRLKCSLLKMCVTNGKEKCHPTSYFQPQNNCELDKNSSEVQGIILSAVWFVYRDLRPVSVVEGKSFEAFMVEMCPKYRVPSLNTLASKIRGETSDICKCIAENWIRLIF